VKAKAGQDEAGQRQGKTKRAEASRGKAEARQRQGRIPEVS
jgi:hypothetical protein